MVMAVQPVRPPDDGEERKRLTVRYLLTEELLGDLGYKGPKYPPLNTSSI